MESNRSIIDAARKTIEAKRFLTEPLSIVDYPGMFVANTGCAKISAMNFFTEVGERFVVGPLRER